MRDGYRCDELVDTEDRLGIQRSDSVVNRSSRYEASSSVDETKHASRSGRFQMVNGTGSRSVNRYWQCPESHVTKRMVDREFRSLCELFFLVRT